MYISEPNLKVGAKSFSTTCEGTCTVCYARRIVQRFLKTRHVWEENLVATHKPDFVHKMSELLKHEKVFRIHVSGRFYSDNYFLRWCEIARRNPGILFWAYDGGELLSLDIIKQRPKNFKLVKSHRGIVNTAKEIDAIKIPPGWDGISIISERFNNCPAIADKRHRIKCVSHCKKCMTSHRKIILGKH